MMIVMEFSLIYIDKYEIEIIGKNLAIGRYAIYRKLKINFKCLKIMFYKLNSKTIQLQT